MMSDFDVMIQRRDQEDAARGYSKSHGGWITSVEGRSIAPPVSAAAALPDSDTRNILIGYSLLFNQVIQHPNGSYMFVRPTAFKDLMLGKTKYFQHSHEDSLRVASTKDGLTLHADEVGIGFKLYIPRTELGRQTREFVRSNAKQAMSAGFSSTNYEKRIVEGIEVCIVLDAQLHEVSLVEFGANDDAFAMLIDDTSDWVTDMCKSNRMTDEMHRSHIHRAMRRLEVLQKELVSAGLASDSGERGHGLVTAGIAYCSASSLMAAISGSTSFNVSFVMT
jgi:HK97 family phage prohead protease